MTIPWANGQPLNSWGLHTSWRKKCKLSFHGPLTEWNNKQSLVVWAIVDNTSLHFRDCYSLSWQSLSTNHQNDAIAGAVRRTAVAAWMVGWSGSEGQHESREHSFWTRYETWRSLIRRMVWQNHPNLWVCGPIWLPASGAAFDLRPGLSLQRNLVQDVASWIRNYLRQIEQKVKSTRIWIPFWLCHLWHPRRGEVVDFRQFSAVVGTVSNGNFTEFCISCREYDIFSRASLQIFICHCCWEGATSE